MMDLAKPGDVAVDRVVVRGVSKDCLSAASLHQLRITDLAQRIPAKQTVTTEDPEITRFGHRDPRIAQGICGIGLALRCRRDALDHRVDFCHLEASNFETELELNLSQR